MYAISQKMKDTLKVSHRPMTVVKVLSISGKTYTIPVSGGTVTIDRKSTESRRTMSFTVETDSFTQSDGTVVNLVPQQADDPLNIYGNHAYIYRGVLWNSSGIDPKLETCNAPIPKSLLVPANGAYELVPLGVFRITSVNISEQDSGAVSITVEGSDLSSNIAKNSWITPVTVWKTAYTPPVTKKGTTVQPQKYVANTVKEAITKLIYDRWPDHSGIFGTLSSDDFNFSGVLDTQLAHPVVMGSGNISTSGSNSPWADIMSLAAGMGAELFLDNDGKFTLRKVADPNGVAPVWDILDGDSNGQGGLLLSSTRHLSADNIRNYVIATGENTSTKTPLKAIAADSDPTSPTYYKGTFGKVVGYEAGRKKLTTQAEVQNAADTYLNYFIGGDESVSLTSVVNPALDVGDVIRVRRKRIGIFNPEAVVSSLTADTGTSAITSMKVSPMRQDIKAGETLHIYTDYLVQTVTTSRAHTKGDTTLYVKSFTPKSDFRKGTVITDPAIPSNGSVNYLIDQISIPLEPEGSMSITARERRIGSRLDAIRSAQYGQQ